jgi:uncharacterized membrane protein YfhO
MRLRTAGAEIKNELNGELLIEVLAPSDGLLVLCDTYYPGWKAYVDGVEQKIYRANHVFRAVPVTEGSHTVRFVYRPRSLLIGAIVSGMALLATVGASVAAVFMRNHPGQHA